MLMSTVREPRRREQMATAGGGGHLSFAAVTSYLRARAGMYGSHFVGMSTVAILAYGLAAWVPTMFLRTWGWTIREVGLAYGIVTLAAGPLAVLLASWLAERLQARGYQDAQMRSALICVSIAVLGAIGAALAPGPWIAVALLLPASIGTTAATANGLAALMTVIPNQMRAQSAAVYYLVVNVFGLTLGPTGIALFTDYVFRDTTALRYSVACIAVIAGVLSACLLSYNLGQYRRAFAESEKWVAGA
jgi:MFS family permease